jgi:hypothetical protein
MGAQGVTTINFGSFPGVQQTSVNVTGQTTILSYSLVDAWLFPSSTPDHSVDEHINDDCWMRIKAAAVVAGTGFTIFGTAMPGAPPLYGQYTVAWVWN